MVLLVVQIALLENTTIKLVKFLLIVVIFARMENTAVQEYQIVYMSVQKVLLLVIKINASVLNKKMYTKNKKQEHV